jgi:SAM-dependent methyltransferase
LSEEQKPPPPLALQKAVGGIYPAAALLAGLELDLFAALADAPSDLAAIAARTGAADAARLEALLDALTVFGFLARTDGVYALAPEARQYLAPDSSGFIGTIAPVYGRMFRSALGFAQAIREAQPLSTSDDGFLAGLHPTALSAAREIDKRIDLSAAERLLDIGCGTAGVAIGLCKRWPQLHASALDLPAAVPFAQNFVAQAGLADRIECAPYDVLASPPPGPPADIAVARALLQVLSPSDAERAVANIALSLKPGGIFVISGAILDDSGLAPPEAVGLNIALMGMFDGGRAHRVGAQRRWLGKAGFGEPMHAALPGGTGMLWAVKR